MKTAAAPLPPIAIDADIHRAQTPPGALYTDPHYYDYFLTHAFGRSWQLMTDATALKVPGSVLPVRFCPYSIDEPLVLTRAADDQLHCLSNVCTHRANLVVEQPGQLKQLQCRYHGRRFGLDGQLIHMPEFEGVAGFPCSDDNLPQTPLHSWGNLLFAAISPFCAFEDWLGPIQERLSWLPLNEFQFDASRSRDYLVQANWALYCDNYLEGFHIPFVHPSLNAVLDYGSYETILHRYCNLQIGYTKHAADAFDLPPESPDYGQLIGGYYYWLFPNLMLNFYPWGLSVNIVQPMEVARTKVSFLTYVWRPERMDKGAGNALDRVEREDEAVVESVMKGVKAKLYRRGRYSPKREQGPHHFHLLLDACLKGEL
jgi:choline monooxygenase